MNKGFTLIEIIIVICIIILVAASLGPVGASFYRQQLLNKTEQQLIGILKQARSNAVNQINNSAFGVYIYNNQAVLFQGFNFLDRESDQDLNYSFSGKIYFSGLSEVVFYPNTGIVPDPGIIIIETASFNKKIEINELGIINY